MNDEPPTGLTEAWPVIRKILELETIKIAKGETDPVKVGHLILASLSLIESVDKQMIVDVPVKQSRSAGRLLTNPSTHQ